MSTNKGLPLQNAAETLGKQLNVMHDDLLDRYEGVVRIACALYDPVTDLLKTFINSTRLGHAFGAYEYPLAESKALTELKTTRMCRVIDDISTKIYAGTEHSTWLLEQGYQSSFTIPMMSGDTLLGFLFFDSDRKSYFNSHRQRDLLLFSNMITMAIAMEVSAVHSLLATANAARDFAQMRDFETGAHLTRMAQLSRLIGKGVAERYGLSDETVEHIYLFAPLHDIGKIGIPDRILLKPGRLDDDEMAVMRQHVEKGGEIINRVLDDYQLSHLHDSAIMTNIVSCHHELLDGSGYPKGLKASEIPVEARIVTVADIFDALTSRRPYKDPWSVDEALAELDKMASLGKLDVHCVEALRSQITEAEDIVEKYVD